MAGDYKTFLKRILGVVLIILGIAALLLPFVPFAWLIFVGLELLGLRTLFWKKISLWLKRSNR